MEIAEELLDWYRREGRDLPWRHRPNPYRVWVSEIMLQQTTVATAGPYFERFIKRYPTVRALSLAREEEILGFWSGLGYYHRARNMLKTAKLIVKEHRGRVPADLATLRSLPGVGPYTAGAIMSIGHNLPFPALDGNIMRVVARLGGITGDPTRALTRRDIELLAKRLIPLDAASVFNQALMDLGAAICSPHHPSCHACPVASHCRARRDGSVESIPPPRAARAPLRVELAALAVWNEDRLMLIRRGKGALMRGMWEFPLVPAVGMRDVERAAAGLGARAVRRAGQFLHTITDHRIVISVYEATLAGPVKPARRFSSRSGTAIRVSEPTLAKNTPVATPAGMSTAKWVTLIEMTRAGSGGLALTGSARKIARLLKAGCPATSRSSHPGAGRHLEA